MRQIRSEDRVSAEAVRGTGGHSALPTVTPYIPNYKGVNQVLIEAPGSAQINFMNALGKMSSQYMAEQQELYDNMEVAEALSNVDMQYNQASEEFLRDNQTGKGYTEFATGKYKELGDEAVVNGSNAGVKDRLRGIFALRRASIANSAFQKEKEMYTGYAMSQTEMQLTRTLNEVATNPDQAISLQAKLEQQLQPMKNILAAQEYDKYRRDMMQQFVYFQGMGIIKKRPFEAEGLLQSEYYKSQLAPNQYMSLQHNAQREREHQELQAKRYQALQDSALKQEQIRDCQQDVILPMLIKGEVKSDAYIMAKNYSLDLKIWAMKQTHEFLEKHDKETKTKQQINTSLEKDEFPEGLTESKQEKYLLNLFKGNDAVKVGENAYMVQTQTEQALFLKERENTFQFRYDPLIRSITTNVRYGREEKQTMDACVALATFHDTPALQGIPQDDVVFAMAATQVYGANNDFAAVQNLQKQYYQATETDIKANKLRFEELTKEGLNVVGGAAKRGAYTNDFYKRYGIELKGKWWWNDDSPDMQKVNTIAYDMIKRIYERTGDQNLAEMTTARYIKGFLKPDKDGVVHINPPSTQNTSFKNPTLLKTVSDGAMRKAVAEAKDAGFGIQAGGRPDEIIVTNPNLVTEGKTVRRKLYYQCEDPLFKRPVYSVYFLADKKEPTSRQYLPTLREGRVIVDFDQLFEAREEAKVKALKPKYGEVAENITKQMGY